MEVNKYISMGGEGRWSNVVKRVLVTVLELADVAPGDLRGTLHIYFDRATWDPRQHGLICGDRTWLHEIRNVLAAHRLFGQVAYSTPNCQGENYVALTVDRDFILSWKKRL